MKLKIAKVDETLFEGEAYSVTLPTHAGVVTVLSDHMPLVSTLSNGTLLLRETRDGTAREFVVESGVVEVGHNSAIVLL